MIFGRRCWRCGVCLAPLGVKLLLTLAPPEQIPWLKVKPDVTVWLVSFGVTALTAVLAGLLPALKHFVTRAARRIPAP